MSTIEKAIEKLGAAKRAAQPEPSAFDQTVEKLVANSPLKAMTKEKSAGSVAASEGEASVEGQERHSDSTQIFQLPLSARAAKGN